MKVTEMLKTKMDVGIWVSTEELTAILPFLTTEQYREWCNDKHPMINDCIPRFSIEPVDEEEDDDWYAADYRGMFRIVFTFGYWNYDRDPNYTGACLESFREYISNFLEYIKDKTGLKLEVSE